MEQLCKQCTNKYYLYKEKIVCEKCKIVECDQCYERHELCWECKRLYFNDPNAHDCIPHCNVCNGHYCKTNCMKLCFANKSEGHYVCLGCFVNENMCKKCYHYQENEVIDDDLMKECYFDEHKFMGVAYKCMDCEKFYCNKHSDKHYHGGFLCDECRRIRRIHP